MSYQVLARKWRPQSFDALVGQETIATALLNALKNDRVPHALLFTGVRGVGKTSGARILAKSLRCTQLKEHIPCGTCSDCQEIAEGRSVDVIEIDGASNNGVENVRELRESVAFMPSHGRYKVYIIDEVHMLTGAAFNALLKTLEEPPPHVVFILATTEVQKIPVTILSRCQRYDFRRVPVKRVAEAINKIAQAEGVKVENAALWLIARESEGSMRDSLSLLDQVISFCGDSITLEKVVEVLGLTDRTLLSQALQGLIKQDAQSALDLVEKIFKLGYDPKSFTQDLLEHIRNLMIVKLSGRNRSDLLDLPDQEIDELEKMGELLGQDDIHLLFDMALKGASDVMRASDPRVVLEMLLLRMSQAPRLVSIQKVIASSGQFTAPLPAPTPAPISALNKIPARSPATNLIQPTPLVKEAAPGAPPTLTWENFLNLVRKEKPLLGAKLEYGSLDTLNAKDLIIYFRKEQEFFFNQISDKDVLKQLSDLIQKSFGQNLAVSTKLGEQINKGPLSPQEAKVQKQKQEQDDLMKKIEEHPLVKEVQNKLKAKISSVKELK